MRYNGIDTVTFTDMDGNEYPVKDIRPQQTFDNATTIRVEKDMFIDDLVSRREFYGDGAEGLSYAIVDHNREKIVEHEFDLSKLKELKIPIIEDV